MSPPLSKAIRIFVTPYALRDARWSLLEDSRRRIDRERQAKDRKVARNLWQEEFDLVFKSEVGKPMQDGQVSWRFHKALKQAGLPRIRIHDLRHTAATQLLERGVHPKIVQEMLGHSTITLTLDTYSHVIPGLHAEAAKQMQRLFDDGKERER